MSKEEIYPEVVIYTDGACSGNPGPGGWASILIFQSKEKKIFGGSPHTTNNQMELTAVIQGLNQLKKKCSVQLYTDSLYVLKGATEWLENWVKKNWKNAKKEPVLNRELWEELIPYLQKHKIEWHWVKGHAGNSYNEQVDELACQQRDLFKKN